MDAVLFMIFKQEALLDNFTVTFVQSQASGLSFPPLELLTARDVSWSKDSQALLTSSMDWNCIIWDLVKSCRKLVLRFDSPIFRAQFHPVLQYAQ